MSSHPSSLKTDTGTGPADLVLVRQALLGDSDSVDQVLTRLSCCVRFVFRLNRTLGYGLPTDGLEDVVQQVYAAIWPRLQDYAGIAALETWAYGFCRNCLRSEARRRLHRTRTVSTGQDFLQQQVSEDPAPREVAERAEGVDLLRQELDRLDELDREIVTLRHLHDWSFERISAVKRIAPSTVKDRCYRAMEKIRFRLKRLGRE